MPQKKYKENIARIAKIIFKLGRDLSDKISDKMSMNKTSLPREEFIVKRRNAGLTSAGIGLVTTAVMGSLALTGVAAILALSSPMAVIGGLVSLAIGAIGGTIGAGLTAGGLDLADRFGAFDSVMRLFGCKKDNEPSSTPDATQMNSNFKTDASPAKDFNSSQDAKQSEQNNAQTPSPKTSGNTPN